MCRCIARLCGCYRTDATDPRRYSVPDGLGGRSHGSHGSRESVTRIIINPRRGFPLCCMRTIRSQYHKRFMRTVNVLGDCMEHRDKMQLQFGFVPLVTHVDSLYNSIRFRYRWIKRLSIGLGIMLMLMTGLQDSSYITENNATDVMYWINFAILGFFTLITSFATNMRMLDHLMLYSVCSTHLKSLGTYLLHTTGIYARFGSTQDALPLFWLHFEVVRNFYAQMDTAITSGSGNIADMPDQLQKLIQAATAAHDVELAKRPPARAGHGALCGDNEPRPHKGKLEEAHSPVLLGVTVGGGVRDDDEGQRHDYEAKHDGGEREDEGKHDGQRVVELGGLRSTRVAADASAVATAGGEQVQARGMTPPAHESKTGSSERDHACGLSDGYDSDGMRSAVHSARSATNSASSVGSAPPMPLVVHAEAGSRAGSGSEHGARQ